MPSPPLAQPRLPAAECGGLVAAAPASAPLHAAPAPAGAFAQQQAYAQQPQQPQPQPQQPQPQPQPQTYAAMLAGLPPASRTEAGNGFYQQTAASVGANSFDPSGGLGAAPGPSLPAAAQPGAWTQNGA